jgi:3-dehydroquinate dehydratase-2
MKRKGSEKTTSKKTSKKKIKSAANKPRAVLPIEIHIINGANLNMLGFISPEIYGDETILDLEAKLEKSADELSERLQQKVQLKFFQTNYEGQMLDYIHAVVLEAREKGKIAGVIINPSSWAHTSIPLRDAVLMLKPVPIVEVHLMNLVEHEDFRHYSFLEDVVDYRVMGMGQEGYLEAFRWLTTEMKKERLDVH